MWCVICDLYGCNLWFDTLICILLQSTQYCMKYHVILERVKMALYCIFINLSYWLLRIANKTMTEHNNRCMSCVILCHYKNSDWNIYCILSIFWHSEIFLYLSFSVCLMSFVSKYKLGRARSHVSNWNDRMQLSEFYRHQFNWEVEKCNAEYFCCMATPEYMIQSSLCDNTFYIYYHFRMLIYPW